MLRRQYNSCFTGRLYFTPIHDLSDEMIDKIYEVYNIPIPEIYNHVTRTGCMGCPYGSYMGETKIELDLLHDIKRQFTIDYFKESYDVLGIDYEHKHLDIFDDD